MRVKPGVFLMVAGLLAWNSATLQAHHSFSAQYDANKPITLTGVETRFVPHLIGPAVAP